MKKILYCAVVAFCVGLLPNLAAQETKEMRRYSALLVCAQPTATDAKARQESESDLRQAENSVANYLADRCQFYDQNVLKSHVERLYKENSKLDPTNLENMMREMQIPARLMVMVEKCEVEQTPDEDFPKDVTWCRAVLKIKIVDNGKKAQTYADKTKQTSRRVFVPTSLRDTRNRAIDMTAQEIVQDILLEMDKRLNEINKFDLRIINLTDEMRESIHNILRDINTVGQASIQDIQRSTDSGITASVSYRPGIQAFKDYFQGFLQRNPALSDMICDPDWQGVTVYPKEKPPEDLSSAEKFEGQVLVAPDLESMKTEKIDSNAPGVMADLKFMKDKLEACLGQRFVILDALATVEKWKLDRARLGESAFSNPTDYLAQQFNMSTHIVYFWVKPYSKDAAGGRYYFAELGVRMVQVKDGKQLEIHRLRSESDIGRGESVKQGEDTAKQEAIFKLTQLASTRMIKKFLAEDPAKFYRPIPVIRIRAGNFSQQPSLAKLSAVLQRLETQDRYKIERTENGAGYLDYSVSIAAGKDYNQPYIKQLLKEACQQDGLRILLQSTPGEIFITQQK